MARQELIGCLKFHYDYWREGLTYHEFVETLHQSDDEVLALLWKVMAKDLEIQ